MTKYQVLHFVGEDLEVSMRGKIPAINKAFFDGQYKDVANLVAENLEEVYQRTQHIKWNWVDALVDTSLDEPEGNKALVKEARSTSIGDIIFDTDSGETFAVAPFGFSKLS